MSINLTTEYVVVTCGGGDGACYAQFAMTRTMYDETKRTGRTWYCPNGHPRVWNGKSTERKLEEAQARQVHLEDQLRATELAAENQRVQQMRERHRIANGVCPCCNRSFENVRRHMAGEHPEFDPGVAEIAKPFKCSCGHRFESFRGLRTHQGHQRSDDWWKPSKGNYWRHLTVMA